MQNGQTQKHWEKIGKSYNVFWKSKAKQELNINELGFINKHLEKTGGQYVLDIGVGSGRIIENYLNNPKIKEIYGIDWAKVMVNFCRNKFKNDKRLKSIAVCDISKEKIFFNRKFNFISAIRVLKYNKNWREIIKKIAAALSEHGIFVFTMPNRYSLLSLTIPETAIYKVTQKEIEKVLYTETEMMVEVTAFSKLPDIFYDLTDNNTYVKLILLVEKFLSKVFGDVFLGREFFIAIRKIN